MDCTVMRLNNITKDYPGIRALDGVSFAVGKGSIHGFIGPNGAGKSTALRIVTGLLRPTKGEVRMEEGLRVGFLPENLPLYDNMAVGEYLEFVRRIYTLKSTAPGTLASALALCGLGPIQKRLIGRLSKGQRQRVGIAQALVAQPQLLILDEPVSGLDPQARVEMRRLLLELKRDHTVLLSGHQLREMELVCTELTIINKGQVVGTGSLDNVRRRFQSGRRFTLRLRRFGDGDRHQLSRHFPDAAIDSTKDGEGTVVRIELPRAEDCRERIGLFAVERDLGLLEIGEERPDLEALFHRATTETPRVSA